MNKKVIIFLFMLLLIFLPITVKASKIEVTLSSCVDGDTAKFVTKDGIKSTRFLAIDTPESTTYVEAYGKEASNFTCNKLTKAKKIELESDPNSTKYDKYKRLLAWVWVDNTLLQDEIVSLGLGKVAYLYGNYEYTDILLKHQDIAKSKRLNIWSEETSNNNDEAISYIILVMVVIVILILNRSSIKLKIKK